MRDSVSCPPFNNWHELQTGISTAENIVKLGTVPSAWYESQTWASLTQEVREAEDAARRIKDSENRLFEEFTEDFAEAADHDLEVRCATLYQSRLRVLRFQYWKDQRFLRGFLRRPQPLDCTHSLEAIRLAREIQRQKQQWNAKDAQRVAIFGPRYRGSATNWEALEADILLARQ